MTGTFTGWDLVEHVTRFEAPPADDHAAAIELDSGTVSFALLVEMQRPPWWRETDRNRKALAAETA